MKSIKLKPLTQKKVAIYTRVSTDEQARTGFGLQYQLEECRNTCKIKGLEIFKEYVDEGVSGASVVETRPKFKELLADAEKGLFSVLCVWKYDRLARNTRIFQNIYYDLQNKFNVELVSCIDDIDTSTNSGKFYLDIMCSVSELELKTIVTRLKNGKDMKRRKDGYIGGILPYGYSKYIDDKKVTIKSDSNAKYVIWIFKMHNEGINMSKIAAKLNESSILSPRGKQWTYKSIKVILDNKDKYLGGLMRDNDNDVRWEQILKN